MIFETGLHFSQARMAKFSSVGIAGLHHCVWLSVMLGSIPGLHTCCMQTLDSLSYIPSQAFALLKYSDVDAVTGLCSVFCKAGKGWIIPHIQIYCSS